MLSTKFRPEKIVVSIGVLLLAGLVFASWVPRDCPYLRSAIATCPHITLAQPATPLGKELVRVPNQYITSTYASFSTAIDPVAKESNTATVRFQYLSQDPAQVSYLQMQQGGTPTDIGLITAPALVGISWQKVNNDRLTLYQRTGGFASIPDLVASKTPATLVAADTIAATLAGLPEGSYTDVTTLKSLDGFNYVLTTMPVQSVDGLWSNYEQSFSIPAGTDQNIKWSMYTPTYTDGVQGFYLSVVHVDYRGI